MAIRLERPHSFASMIGLAPRAKRAEDKDPKEVEDDAKAAKAAAGDDSDPPKDTDDKAAKAAAGDGDNTEAKRADAADGDDCPTCGGTGEDDAGDDCDACDGTGKKAKKAKAKTRAADEKPADDDGEEKGKRAERKRWGFVMAKAIPEGKALAACALLHDTPMAAAKIVETLAVLPADQAGKAAPGLRGRMAQVNTPVIAPDGPGAGDGSGKPTGAKALAAQMLAARDKALGRKPAA